MITNCNIGTTGTSHIAQRDQRASCSVLIVSSSASDTQEVPMWRGFLVRGSLRSGKSEKSIFYNARTVNEAGLFDMESEMRPLWKKGDVVTIYQLAWSKGLLVEGRATVVKPVGPDGSEHYMVRFHRKDGTLDREAYERFIDRDGQTGDPQDYIKAFNAKCGIEAA